MDSQNIKPLLEKYWNGETTAEEENLLRAYHRTHPEAFEKEEVLFFENLDRFSEASLGEAFTDQFMESLEERALLTKRPLRLWIRNIAAAVLLLVTASAVFYTWNENRKAALIRQAETEAAYEQAKQALALISAKLNKGAEVAYSLDRFSTTQEKIQTDN